METTGNSSPLGATVVDGGVNFSLFSRDARGVELLLFDRPDDAKPVRAISLDPVINRTYHYWHVFVPEYGSGSHLLFNFLLLGMWSNTWGWSLSLQWPA